MKKLYASNQLSSYWVNFRKTGNPNGTGLTEWKPYTSGQKMIAAIGEEIVSRPIPDAASLDLLVRLLQEH